MLMLDKTWTCRNLQLEFWVLAHVVMGVGMKFEDFHLER